MPSFCAGSRSSRLQMHEKRKRNTVHSIHSLSDHSSVGGKVFKSYITSMASREKSKAQRE